MWLSACLRFYSRMAHLLFYPCLFCCPVWQRTNLFRLAHNVKHTPGVEQFAIGGTQCRLDVLLCPHCPWFYVVLLLTFVGVRALSPPLSPPKLEVDVDTMSRVQHAYEYSRNPGASQNVPIYFLRYVRTIIEQVAGSSARYVTPPKLPGTLYWKAQCPVIRVRVNCSPTMSLLLSFFVLPNFPSETCVPPCLVGYLSGDPRTSLISLFDWGRCSSSVRAPTCCRR